MVAHVGAMTRYYITTAISYPNGAPHIGHAYEAVTTDAIARFRRLQGFDVRFLTGTDEHGLKMKQTATREGLTPRALADRNTQRFREMATALGCSNDDFIRTTEERHARSCQAIWRRMAEAGDIYQNRYAGWYSVRDEAFYAESETTVGEDGIRRGAQGTPVEWTEEETFFFRLSAYRLPLLAHYAANPDFIAPPERRNEVVNFVISGLQDLSVSRTTFDWGIPVPDASGHIMYVWVDALTNYISALNFPDETDPLWAYWPANVHVIGKDISRFHAVYWPAFLMSAGLPLPKQVFAHGFLTVRGEKMSKSLGNVVDPFSLIETYGLDQLRYFLMREVPFGQDGSYSHEAIVTRTNADLANDLGNLAQRSLSMIAKNCDGRLPEMVDLTAADQEMLARADALHGLCVEAMERLGLHKVLEAVWAVVGEANRYFAASEPWAHKKTNPARMGTILAVTAEVLRQAGILIQPFMPGSAEKLLDTLAVPLDQRGFEALGAAGRMVAGTALPAPQPIFPRYVEPEEVAS